MLDALDCGKPLKDNKYGDLPLCVRIFEYYAGVPDKYSGKVYPSERTMFNFSIREPYGVVAGIIPWNYPFLNACIKLAPALAAGNTVVLKMAEQTPLSTIELANLCTEAGIPPGVVNVVNGGRKTGNALCAHPGIDKISFTGSTETGKKILHTAAERVLPVTLEMGGKGPSIVFADADMDQAIAGVSSAHFLTLARSVPPVPGCWSSNRLQRSSPSAWLRRPRVFESATRPARRSTWGRWSTTANWRKCTTILGSAKPGQLQVFYQGAVTHVAVISPRLLSLLAYPHTCASRRKRSSARCSRC